MFLVLRSNDQHSELGKGDEGINLRDVGEDGGGAGALLDCGGLMGT